MSVHTEGGKAIIIRFPLNAALRMTKLVQCLRGDRKVVK